ncbi:MAG: glycosyltransferase [Actinomycetota bacterium]|nr:glycosyltransferase [Actinomycetota bacterium]
MPSPEPGPVVALVAAHDMAASVGPTVAALRSLAQVDDVLVIDDGSGDGTGEAALAAGARVLRLPVNEGKGGAVRAGVAATPDAGVYLLVDADVGASAGMAERLLPPVLEGDADLAVGVLPGAGGRGGLGLVRRLAAAGIRLATGADIRAPLSGQRAVRAGLLRQLPLAERFGLETAMTIDARRAGAAVVEVDVDMEHRHRGRSVVGFGHRARQGADIVRALWPRLTSAGQRMAAIVAVFVLLATAAVWSGRRVAPLGTPLAAKSQKVVLLGVPGLSLDQLGTGTMPNLDALAARGASGAAAVRTLSDRPSTAEGYATLGAGAKVRVDAGAQALPEQSTPSGRIVVPDVEGTIRLNERRHVSSLPGALGDALHRAGRRTAVIGSGAVALMDSNGSVDAGRVDPELGADPVAVGRELAAVLDRADVVLVGLSDVGARGADALASADQTVRQVADVAGGGALLLVVSVSPPGEDWGLTPMVAVSGGLSPGQLRSPSTRRPGLVTLTDIAPTVLEALELEVPEGMVGHALRYRSGAAELGLLRSIERNAALREDLYSRVLYGFIAAQAVVYLLAILGLRVGVLGRGPSGRADRVLRLLVLAFAAWPLSTFAAWAVPGVARLGGWVILYLLAVDALIVALAARSRRHPLSSLAWICAATLTVLTVDVATGARLQLSSFLGYSGPYTAGRFSGFGNTAFAALASSAIVVAAFHLHRAARRAEALVTVACLLALVLLVDGAPWLGSDVGGILTLVPVFGLAFVGWAGGRLSWRTVVVAAAGTVAALALAVGIDVLRPPDARTHLGQLAARVGEDGLDPMVTTIARKLAGSLRTFGSPWSWTIPVITLYGLYVLVRARGLPELLANRSPLRVGAIAMVAAGLLGCLVNDSGVVVTAVVFVYVAPFLTLLVLHRSAEPILLAPGTARTGPEDGSVSDPLLLRR